MSVGSRYGITSFSNSPHTLYGWKFWIHLLRHWRSPMRMCIA